MGLHVSLRTTDAKKHGYTFDSFAHIPRRRWTHVALMMQGELIQLYVNGIRDNRVILTGRYRINGQPWFVGGAPGHSSVKCFIDDFRVYSEGLEEGTIQALSTGALGSVSPLAVKLSCPSCTSAEASNCGEDYHLCWAKELFGGALQAARANGWFATNIKKVWTANDKVGGSISPTEKRLGLCCRNSM